MWPLDRRTIVLAAIPAALGWAHSLGQFETKIGSFTFSDFPLWWCFAFAGGVFLVAPRRERRLPVASSFALGIVMLFALWPMERWRQSIQEHRPIHASLFQRGEAVAEREVSFDLLDIDKRSSLHRITRRRRNVVLESSNFLYVPQTGLHRFHLHCDDRCSLSIDGNLIGHATGSSTVETYIEEGLHRLYFSYEQRGGPAFFFLGWDRPSFLELLPLRHYVSHESEDLDPSRIRARENAAAIYLVLGLLWWFIFSLLLLRWAESTPRSLGVVLGVLLFLTNALLYHTKLDELTISQIGVDDANIYFVYADNFLASGELVWNVGGERVEGFSSVLWQLICILHFFLFDQPESALTWFNLALVSVTLSLWAVFLARSLVPAVSSSSAAERWSVTLLVTVWLFACPYFFIWNFMSLLETGLWTASIMLAFVAIIRFLSEPSSRATTIGFSAALCLMVFTRPEGVALGFGVLVYCALRLRTRGEPVFSRLSLPLTIFVMSCIFLHGGRYFYFGFLFPNTYYAKVGPFEHSQWMEGISYLVSFARAYPIAWVVWILALWKCLTVLWRGARSSDTSMRNEYVDLSTCASWIILTGAAMTVAVGGDHFEGWRFFIPYWPIYFAVLVEPAVSLGTVMGKSSRAAWTARTATAILVGAIISTYVYNPARWADLSTSGLRNEFYLANLGRRIGNDLNLFFEGARHPSLGVIAAGGIGYAYEGWTVDLPGLNNVLMAHESKDRGGPKNHAVFDPRIFYRQLPDVLVALNPYCERGNPKRKFGAFQHDYRLLKHIHREAEFRRLYTPVVIPSLLRSKSFGLCLFMRRGFLEESERSGDIASFTYNAVGL